MDLIQVYTFFASSKSEEKNEVPTENMTFLSHLALCLQACLLFAGGIPSL